MGFEIRDGKENLPDEEDIYGVNDAEERERFDALFGIGRHVPYDEAARRSAATRRAFAWVMVVVFAAVPVLFLLARYLGL